MYQVIGQNCRSLAATQRLSPMQQAVAVLVELTCGNVTAVLQDQQ